MNGAPLSVCARFALVFLVFLLFLNECIAQPPNDNCGAPSVISISNNGFGIGSFSSSVEDVSLATVQTGESFAPAILLSGQNAKSIWYKFTLPTTRQVKVTLAQVGSAITAGDIGFTVYKFSNCLPANSDISTKLTPIALFGDTYHPCVEMGIYYVQVSAKASANGPVYISVETGLPAALYDKPSQAYSFGTLDAFVRTTGYPVGCQSIEDGNETCNSLANYMQYTKSSWHIFKTPSYFDYIALMVAKQSNSSDIIGYRIYEGNVTINPYTSLPLVVPCDTLRLDSTKFSYRLFKCNELQRNKTYSLQLFFKYNFSGNVKVSFALAGTSPTNAPLPVLANIPPVTNALGILPTNGTILYPTDFFGCNSRHSINACGPAVTATGVKYLPNNVTYNLSSFFTFSLANTSNLTIALNQSDCGTMNLVRLFHQGVGSGCSMLDTLNIVSQFIGNSGNLRCVPAGDYTLQVMGSDSIVNPGNWNYNTIPVGDSSVVLCFQTNLGHQVSFEILAEKVKAINQFSLNTPGAYDTINAINGVMQPLSHNVMYTSKADTFGCLNTVRPWDTACFPGLNKVMYRELMIADSAVLSIFNPDSLNNKLYKGDAGSLATAQNVFAFPQKIFNLVPWSNCIQSANCDGTKVCVVPGTYTYTTFGSDGNILHAAKPSFRVNSVVTQFGNPANAENMGDILSQLPATGGALQSAIDYFSCKDNAVPIDGFMPCGFNYIPATKAIYREFYLSAPSLLTITGFHFDVASCSYAYGGIMALFSGKASNGLSTLHLMPMPWQCFKLVNASSCNVLPAGWYTIVSYGTGPSYSNPMQNLNQELGYGSHVASTSMITISLVTGCAAPKYNRPYKAAIDTVTNQPFLVDWGPNGGHTNTFPKTDKTYSLYPEYFNCTNDTPFASHPIPTCNAALTKVAYWVFKTTQESYVQINTQGYWGTVYMGNARTDSSSFSNVTNIQPCLNYPGKIQICKLQPGIYTLVVFADSTANCQSIQPVIYTDRVGVSRFDHAATAYDFGLVPPDSAWHSGKTGDVNPLDPGRAPSNDFIYCTTGAQLNDPFDPACSYDYLPNIYNPGVNNYMYPPFTNDDANMPRRNLWYTFVTDQGGYIRVKVANKTIGKNFPYRFAVYKSDVNGLLSFSQVVSTGSVDSTIAQGLTLVATQSNSSNNCYVVPSQISFYKPPCNAIAERYYILVENTNSYPIDSMGMKPNSQLEVSILIDSVNSPPVLFNHYSTPGIIGTNLGPGYYAGPQDNFSCATKVPADPLFSPYPGNLGCSYKTLWYKFSTNITGKLRYRVKINGNYAYGSSTDQAVLLRQQVPGDSTTNGLNYIAYQSVIYETQTNSSWHQACILPGTYYLFLPGCNRVNETVVPEIIILEEKGDFCSAPVVASLNGAGSTTATVTIDCHTIGTDYGEFNPTLTCPAGANKNNYKSSWIKINITGNDTLDVTTFLTENTNALSTDIKYRIMEGNCSAMQEQSCVQDALTHDTYKCLPPGNYFVQLFVPVFKNGNPVIGDVTLNISSVKHADTCAPMKGCLSTAVFLPQYDCSLNDTVTFLNLSTYGTDIQYLWDFGYNNQTSTAVSPFFVYPALPSDQVYTVKLKVTNIGCIAGSKNIDSASVQLLIKGRPHLNLGKDTVICKYGSSLVLNASTWPGTTYHWSSGQTTSSITISNASSPVTFWVEASYNGCTKRDSITVAMNPIDRIKQDKFLCGNDSVLLQSIRGFGETYLWNGSINPWNSVDSGKIYVSAAGLYINQMNWKGCVIIDSFNVIKAAEPFNKTDTTICFPFHSFLLNATTPGALAYTWHNGSSNPTLMVTTPGVYSVGIWNGTCLKKDTIKVSTTPAAIVHNLNGMICNGQSYALPWGAIAMAPGIYRDTQHYANGCDSLVRIVVLDNQPFVKTIDTAICAGKSYMLPWGQSTTTTGWYSDTIKTVSGCDSLIRIVKLKVNPKPVVTVLKSNDVNCKLGTARLTASGGDHYIWSPAASLSNTTIRNPIASPTSTTTYFVQAISQQGCVSTDSIRVVVAHDAGPGFELPTAFTPDGDGLNDCFGVRSWGAVSELKLAIYSRWGELIFQTSDPSKCWDGNFKGKELTTAVFVYQVSANTICGKVYRKGTVTLIR